MKLPQYKIDFLLKYQHRVAERSFLIDMLTVVKDCPTIIVTQSELPAPDKPIRLDIDNHGTLTFISPATAVNSTDNAAMMWCVENNIELILNTTNYYTLVYAWRNWQTMPIEKKLVSDKESKSIYRMTNEVHVKQLLRDLPAANKPQNGDVVTLITEHKDTALSCRAYIEVISDTVIMLHYLNGVNTRIMGETDTFIAPTNSPRNNKIGNIETTVGRFILNKLLLDMPFFGDTLVPYVNKVFKFKEVSSVLAGYLFSKKISVVEFKQHLDNLFFIGHFTELCVPVYTTTSLVTDPAVKKRKGELLAQHEGHLDDPLVIAAIEDELLAMDAVHLSADASMRFYTPLNPTLITIARKKMYLTVGGIEAFSKDSGKYVFIENALSEGWAKDSIPAISNEIRKGTYSRSRETQLGGAQTKYIMRVFQDLIISEKDCGTTRGLAVDFSKVTPSDYIGHYIYIDKQWVPITEDMLPTISGNKYTMRSAMYCNTKNGLCYTCVGDKFARLQVKHVTASAIDISSTFMYSAMKNMHGSKLSLIDITNLEKYVV